MYLLFLISLLFFLFSTEVYIILDRIKLETITYIELYQKLNHSEISRKIFFKIAKSLILKKQLTYGREFDKASYVLFRRNFKLVILEIIFFYAFWQTIAICLIFEELFK